MAQPAASPTPNVLNPPLVSSLPAHAANPLFYPRKEFLRDHPRVYSSFSLLTLAGHGLVRLYSFPDSVINALRRIFDHQNLILSCRENATNHFFEFSLDRRPWAKVKSLVSEKLIVSILAIIYQYGYSFLSTIEYAREQDDRIAIAFSRPAPTSVNSSIPAVPNGSASTLPQAGPVLFAISFPNTSLLRVIEPPLPLTPAILQAVRNAWPRGIASEKKVGDSYEFKLAGYKWFQENTFAVDSLQQILSLLTAVDRHSFTLLTSLTLGDRSRSRDFWIFIGPPGETSSPDSPPSSPAGSSLELKREVTPQHVVFPPNMQGNIARAISPYTSSPLKQMTPSTSTSTNSKLRKPFPKAQLPLAFQSDSSLNDVGRLPSDVGSVDMTGVGAHRNGDSPAATPSVFYTTNPVQPGNVYQQEFNPWNRSAIPIAQAASPPTAHFFTARQHSRHYSMSSTDDPSLVASIPDSPYDIARPGSHSSSSNNSRMRRASSPLASSPLSLTPQPLRLSPSSEIAPQTQLAGGLSGDATKTGHMKTGSDPPRIPTPPLLSPGAFRDSAFSSSTGWRSTEVPITWTGKDPDPMTAGDGQPSLTPSLSTRIVPHGPRERRASGGAMRNESLPQSQSPPERRPSGGPALPGAWALTPKEEKRLDDVVGNGGTPPIRSTNSTGTSQNNPNMIPPTIREQPSQEGEDLGERKRNVKVHSPEQHRAEGEGARKSQAAWVGNTQDRQGFLPPNATMPKSPSPATVMKSSPMPVHSTTAMAATIAGTNGTAHPHPQRPHAPRSSSISEGWVLVNIDAAAKGLARVPGQQRPGPLKHQRSQSDSRIPASMHSQSQAQTQTRSPTASDKATMSGAAKAIVIVDAKAASKEKAQSGGKLRRLLGRTPDKASNGAHTPESSTSSQTKGKSFQTQGTGNGTASPQTKARQGTPQANGGTKARN